MIELFQRIWCLGVATTKMHRTKVKFFVVGALNTAVGLAAYPILYALTFPLNLHYLVVLLLCQLFCVPFSFLTNKFLVFQTSGNYAKEFSKFVTFHLSYFVVNLAALPTLVEIAGMNPMWAQPFFALLVVVTSYFWHSRFTFRHFNVPRK